MGQTRKRTADMTNIAIVNAKEEFHRLLNSVDGIDEIAIVDFVYEPKSKLNRWARLSVILAASIYETESHDLDWYIPSTKDCHDAFPEAKNILRRGRPIILKVVGWVSDDEVPPSEDERATMWEVLRGKRDRSRYKPHDKGIQ